MDFFSFWATAARWAFWKTERTEGTVATLVWVLPAWASVLGSVGFAMSTEWWSYVPPLLLFVLLFMAAPYRVHRHGIDEKEEDAKKVSRAAWDLRKQLQAYERQVPQSAVDDLARLRSEGVNAVWAARIGPNPTAQDELGLYMAHHFWAGKVGRLLQAHFSQATYELFTNLGPIPMPSGGFKHSVSERHTNLLSVVHKEFEIIDGLIERHNRDLQPRRSREVGEALTPSVPPS